MTKQRHSIRFRHKQWSQEDQYHSTESAGDGNLLLKKTLVGSLCCSLLYPACLLQPVVPTQSAMLHNTHWTSERRRYVCPFYIHPHISWSKCRPKLATRLHFRLTRKAMSTMALSITRVNGKAKLFSLSSKISPLAHNGKDLDDDQRNLERPSEEEVQATTEKTRQALEKLVTGKKQPMHQWLTRTVVLLPHRMASYLINSSE